MTVDAVLSTFLLDQQVKGNSINTVSFYRSCIGYFVSFVGNDFDVSGLTLPMLKSYYVSLSGRNLSSVTIQTYVRALRCFLSWCYDEEYCSVDFSQKFRLPKAKRKVIDTLTDSEVRQLMSCFNLRYNIHLRNYCICCLMLDCGLRMNEAVTLTVSALHLSDGYIVVEGKGNKQRIVPLGLQSRKVLLKYLSHRPALAATDRLFLMGDMRPISLGTVKQLFRKLKKRSGIPRLKAHLLRHTFATRFLENGGDIYALQQILGHTSLEMVKRYVHTTPRKTVSKFLDFSPLDNLI
ncbi:tyrosine-type recombinase/integrase [Oscillospiraceae bacterium LTW-04]|nr:tyrosine-type recombinase/integrase [Oscillospiraceae bacterium MB24-C1]WMJ84448.1 tyrosine-type recombinase/integrase [Oscillospiraceae bacterium MB24-C1]